MYKDFFGFRELPFKNALDLINYYPSERNGKIEQEVLKTIKEFRVPLLTITGDRNAGKSILGLKLLDNLLEEGEYKVVLLVVTKKQGDFDSFLKKVIRHIDISGEEIKSVIDFIEQEYNKEKEKTIFLIDNSDNLAGEEAIVNLLRLTELKDEDGRSIISFILLGSSLINEWVEKNEKLKGVTKQYPLGAFSLADVKGYIDQRLELYGGKKELFSEKIKENIFESLDKKNKISYPFWINVLCDAIFLQAFLLDKKSVEMDLVKNVLEKTVLNIKV